jgi:hypothetical protein
MGGGGVKDGGGVSLLLLAVQCAHIGRGGGWDSLLLNGGKVI